MSCLVISLNYKETVRIITDTGRVIEINLHYGSTNHTKIVIDAPRDIKVDRIKKEEDDE